MWDSIKVDLVECKVASMALQLKETSRMMVTRTIVVDRDISTEVEVVIEEEAATCNNHGVVVKATIRTTTTKGDSTTMVR